VQRKQRRRAGRTVTIMISGKSESGFRKRSGRRISEVVDRCGGHRARHTRSLDSTADLTSLLLA
jgi:hypothetical protein